MKKHAARAKRLAPIMKLAEQKQQQALHLIAQSQQRLLQLQQRAAQLQEFREQYTQMLNNNQVGAFNSQELLQLNTFMTQIDTGIDTLQQQLEAQLERSRLDEQAWLSAKQRTDGLEKVIDKLESMQAKIKLRRDELQLDEHAQTIRRNS